MRKSLLLYFDDWIVAVSLLILFFATNLYIYGTTESGMSHAYSFGLFGVFIWYVIKWHQSYSVASAAALGITFGLITLLRPTNILIGLLFLFYDVNNLTTLFNKIKLLIINYRQVLLMAFLVLLSLVPQLVYWKNVTHQWVCYSYNNEGFFFDHPKIIDGLFSYRNGWLLYSPLMILALAGIPLIKRYAAAFMLAIPIAMIVCTYVILSWWCWWYVGFGNRAFVEFETILSVPLCALISFVFKKSKVLTTLLFFVILTAGYISNFQVWQYKSGIIHWDSMNKSAYWAIFLKREKPPGFDYLLTQPDYKKALLQREDQ